MIIITLIAISLSISENLSEKKLIQAIILYGKTCTLYKSFEHLIECMKLMEVNLYFITFASLYHVQGCNNMKISVVVDIKFYTISIKDKL